jgi:hypothetical protein
MKRSCPDIERIGDYIEGHLNADDRSRLEKHLSECETCRQEFLIGKGLVRGADVLEPDPVPQKVTQSALRLVNRHVSISEIPLSEKCVRFFREMRSTVIDLFCPALWERWGFASIRGSRMVESEDLVHLRKRFGDMETEIEIERVGEGKAHIRVKLIGDLHRNGGVRVTLKRGEREVSSYLPDNQGDVFFESIPFGHYSLQFIKHKTALGTYSFEIKESRYGKK